MVTENKASRIAVLGAKGVGKTAIVVRFLTRRFLPEYQSGIETIYRYDEETGDVKNIQIIDTCGNNDDLCNLSSAIVLVFSVTSRKSYEYVKNLAQWLSKRKSDEAVFTIIANKVDLNDNRQVTELEASNFAKSVSASYHEVSAAKDIEPIRDIFMGIFVAMENLDKGNSRVKSKKSKAISSESSGKRKHSSIKDIFKKRPSV